MIAILAACFALSSSSVAAAPPAAAPVPGLQAAEAALAGHPLDPTRRLALGVALLQAPGRQDEGLEVLRWLIEDRGTAAGFEGGAVASRIAAQQAVTARLLEAPPRRSWERVYKAVLVDAGPREAALLRERLVAIATLPKPPTVQPAVTPVRDPAAAWLAAPDDAGIARLWGEACVGSGDMKGAMAPLSVVLDAWPADRAVLGLHSKAAIASGQAEAALERVRRAVAAAPDAKARDTLIADLVAVAVVAAEQEKAAEHQPAALANYLTALALRPRSASVVLGAAGLEWQAQQLEAAWELYRWGLTLEPGRVDALLGAVTVGLGAGHDDEARLLLEGVRSSDPRVAALRASVERAERAHDARAAVRAGDAERAVAEFQTLLEEGRAEPEFFHGLADALASLGRYDEAILAWREAFRLDPGDAWAVVGEANALVVLQRPAEALGRLTEAFPVDPPPGAANERARVEARAWRMQGDAARAVGDRAGALERYAQALRAAPDVWGCVAVAGLYLEDHQPSLALAFYDEALGYAAGEDVAIAGKALALEALGQPTEALALLDQQIARAPSEVNRAARADLAPRVVVAQAMRARVAGNLAAAQQELTQALETGRKTAGLYAALAVVDLDLGEVDGAVEAALRGMATDPGDAWARAMVVSAGRACGCTSRLLDVLEGSAKLHPGEAATRDLNEALLDAALQEASRRHHDGREVEAVAALQRADRLADRPELASRVGGGWLALGRGREALVVFERALTSDPDDVVALIGRAGASEALGRLAAAENALARDFARLKDPRLGIALADVQRRRGRYPLAAHVLADLETTVSIPAPGAGVAAGPSLPALPLPGGGPPPVAPPPTQPPATVLDVSADKERVSAEIARHRAPRVSAAVAVLSRGFPGAVGLDALLVPLDTGPSPAGPVRLNLELVPIHLSDSAGTDDGVAASLGLATPDARLLSFNARLGTSPIGFQGGVYPTWSARLAARPLPAWSVGLVTGRAPRADSRVSWAGEIYPATGQLFGRVSEIWGQLWTSWSPPHADLGLSGRGGYVEGIGVAPNPFGEGVVWAGRTFPVGEVNLRTGVDGVAFGYARREDEFVPGHGGYFSPSLFVLGLARLDADYKRDRVGLCAGVGVGPRYQPGGATAFAGSGVAAIGTAHVGLAVRLAARWDLALDSRGQLGTDGWHQIGAMGRLVWGVPTTLPGAPSLSTLAAPGLALPADGQACTVAP